MSNMTLRLKYLRWLSVVVILSSLVYLFKLAHLTGWSSRVSQVTIDSSSVPSSPQHRKRLTYQPDRTKTTLKVIVPTKESLTNEDNRNPLVLLQEATKSIYKEFRSSVTKFRSAKFIKKALRNRKRYVSKEQVLPDCQDKPFLFIGVHSSPKSFLARQAIRLSWGRPSNDINKISTTFTHERTWKTVFLLGKSTNQAINTLIQRESNTYKDIVVGDFLDTYRNLTLKTLLTLEWSANHCSSAEYVLKTDQDCYINVFSVMKWLHDYHKAEPPHKPPPLYMGSIHWKNTPSRGNTSKYYVTMQEFSGEVYPPYAAGGGYVFTASLIPEILEASKSTAVFPMEDAYFGSLMKRVGVKPTNHKLILPYTFCACNYWKNGKEHCEGWFNDSVCNIAVVMVIHDVRPTEQLRTHVNVLTVQHVPSICKHERIRESWDTNCKIDK